MIEFISIGKNGPVKKRILFSPPDAVMVNLAFGDIDEYGKLNDRTVTDNGDRNKVLATVVHAVELYFNKYPERWIYFRGSTSSRMRLYRMAITIHLEELLIKFDIYAEQRNRIIYFQKNIEAEAILVKKK